MIDDTQALEQPRDMVARLAREAHEMLQGGAIDTDKWSREVVAYIWDGGDADAFITAVKALQ